MHLATCQGGVQFVPPLEMITLDGQRRKAQTANARGLLRIIQSIPSPNDEPFKQWQAIAGYERVQVRQSSAGCSKTLQER